MADETAEEGTADLTVYDLAEKAAKGQPLSDQAHKEVAAECLRLKQVLDRAHGLAGTLAAVLEWTVC